MRAGRRAMGGVGVVFGLMVCSSAVGAPGRTKAAACRHPRPPIEKGHRRMKAQGRMMASTARQFRDSGVALRRAVNILGRQLKRGRR